MLHFWVAANRCAYGRKTKKESGYRCYKKEGKNTSKQVGRTYRTEPFFKDRIALMRKYQLSHYSSNSYLKTFYCTQSKHWPSPLAKIYYTAALEVVAQL